MIQVYWATDSNTLAFVPVTGSLCNTADNNILYDVPTQSSTEHSGWGLQPELTLTEQAAFSPSQENDATSFMFVSSDGNYIAYVSSTEPNIGGELAIAARQSLTVAMTDIYVSSPVTVGGFQVWWSAESTSFVVQIDQFSDLSEVLYVANANTTTPTIELLEDITIGTETYLSYIQTGVYDIADDGTTVLLRMAEYDPILIDADPFNQPYRLIAWNPTSPTTFKVMPDLDAKQIASASFVGSSSDSIVFLDAAGLAAFDLTAQTYNLITSEFNSAGYDHPGRFGAGKSAYFSPDSRWLAIAEVVFDQPYQARLTLIDVASYTFNAK